MIKIELDTQKKHIIKLTSISHNNKKISIEL
jgi:hypothetical protein